MQYNNKGFTLLEFLVYLGIVTVIVTALTLTTIESIMLGAKSDAAVTLRYQAQFVADRMIEEIQNAIDLNTVSSLFDTNPGKLSLATTNPSTNPTIIDVSNNAIRLTRGLENAVFLTSNTVRITQLIFSLYSKPGTPGTIKFILELTPADARQTPPLTLEGSVSLRQ